MKTDLKRRKIITMIAGILLSVVYIMIFRLSADNGESSSDISLKVTKFLVNCYYSLFGSGNSAAVAAAADTAEGSVRKLAHLTEYMMVGILSYTIIIQWLKSRWKCFFVILIQLIVSAGLDEIHQYFVPGRYSSVRDVFLDTAGGIAGIFIVIGVRGISKGWKYIQRRESKTYF